MHPSPTPLDIDDQLYSALAGLSSSILGPPLSLTLAPATSKSPRHRIRLFHPPLLASSFSARYQHRNSSQPPRDPQRYNQLCQWSSIGTSTDSLLLASHLTVHLPSCIGAYVLANHKTNASLVTDPDVAGQNSRSNYVVKQRTQYRSPMLGSEMALAAARTSASTGHVPPGLIPFLAAPNTDIIQPPQLDPALSAPRPSPK